MFFKSKNPEEKIMRKTEKLINSLDRDILRKMNEGYLFHQVVSNMFLQDLYQFQGVNIYYNLAHSKIMKYYTEFGFTVRLTSFDRHSAMLQIEWDDIEESRKTLTKQIEKRKNHEKFRNV